MRNIIVEQLARTPVEAQQVELVERKGVGHPDSICDAIMETVSTMLCKVYEETFGRIVHHNIDKGLLVAGQTTPCIGGGTVDEPMKLIFGDRATYEWQGKTIPVGEIARTVAGQWFQKHLRFVDPEKHLLFQNEIKPASPELADLFVRGTIGANDTSAAVGYAPLTPTERLVLRTEHYLNSPDFKALYPESGEDVKVMAYRYGRNLTLTIAMAFVDRFVSSEAYYFARKEEIIQDLCSFITRQQHDFDQCTVDLNTLDVPGRGAAGMYLTVLGTSAEGADSGQVGRGNRVNGVISLNRPMSTEAAAGKNPVSHVGKIYNLLCHQIAEQVYQEVSGIQEVYIWLCSQIGRPIAHPLIASVQMVLHSGVNLEEVRKPAEDIIERELEGISHFTKRLARGELPVW
jgi:S-adenosylmethionine synthetase